MCHFWALLEPQIGGITVYDFVISWISSEATVTSWMLAGVTSIMWT